MDAVTVNAKLKLGFSQELVPLILSGKMTTSYRLGFKYDFLEIGDLIELENSQTKETIGLATITAKKKVTFLDLPQKFNESLEGKRKRLESYYKTSISNSDNFLMLEFNFLTNSTDSGTIQL